MTRREAMKHMMMVSEITQIGFCPSGQHFGIVISDEAVCPFCAPFPHVLWSKS